MATLNARLETLERVINSAPMVTLQVDTAPTPEQQATIDRCTRMGRRLIVFCMPGDTAWTPGYGLPPWELTHENA